MLSDTEILEAKDKGLIIIDPYDEEQLNPNSYDVRLGNHAWKMQGGWTFDRDNISENYRLHTLSDRETFNFCPGEFYLGHTIEFIGAIDGFAPHLMTKSSPARTGLQIHLAAGFGDVGFANRWTLEIVNLGLRPVEVYPGERIGQIAWTKVGPVKNKYQGKYLQKTKDEWQPSDMLPRWPVKKTLSGEP